MFKAKKNNFWIMAGVIVIAIVARLYGVDLELLSLEQKVSVILSVFVGVLSVIGLYLLVKELFDEKLATLSSFLLAVSFWHVMVSKLGSKDIFTSFTLIFAFYFLWNGLKYGRIFDFFLAGLFGGAGFYASRGYFIAPLAVLPIFCNYWDYIKNDFSLSKYGQIKAHILGGFSLLFITVIAVILPVGFYVWQNPGFILSADNFVLANSEPFAQIYENFIWIVDKLLLINFGNGNLISWPLSIFFVIGLIKEMTHWLKKKHGHLSVAHTLIFSWLFIMPIPLLLSTDLPSAPGLSIILPPIMILSAKGLWWVIEKLNKWNYIVYPHQHKDLVGLDAAPLLAMVALLLSIAVLEISKIV